MKQLLIVFSNCINGKEEEFNDWYSQVHIRDVMRNCPGAIAVQRFELAADQLPCSTTPEYKYLAIYEADAHAGLTEGHKLLFSPAMPVSEAINLEDIRAGYYEPIMARKWARGPEPTGDVIVERISAAAGGPGFAEHYAEGRFSRLMQLDAIQLGRVAVATEHQLFHMHQDSVLLGIYHTGNRRNSLREWNALPGAEIACYTPITPRITVHAAFNPDSEQKIRSGHARERVGKGCQPVAPADM